MDIVPLSDANKKPWDVFCMQSDDAWFWHTTDWIDYTLDLRPDLKSKQMSFMVKNNNEILAVCPLILNTIQEDGKTQLIFSFDHYFPGSTPALKNGITPKQRSKLYKLIFNHIDNLAIEFDVSTCLMKISSLCSSFYNSIPHNYIMKYGFLNTSLNTQVIDLSRDLTSNLNEMRESHRYDLRRGEKHFEIVIYDKNNITKEIFDQYCLLHHKAAGRVTRPLSTFTRMYNWILENKAILCGARYKGNPLSFALVCVYKEGAFYASSSDDPEEHAPAPLSHGIQWSIISWLKNNKYRWYEIGLQQWGDQIYDFPTEKDISISFFKRGFGGMTVPVFSGEKYYSRDYFSKVMAQRIKNFVTRYPWKRSIKVIEDEEGPKQNENVTNK